MTPGRQQAIADVLTMLREDIIADVRARDGMPLTGQNVAAAFGELAAQVDCLAHVCQALLEDIVPISDQPGVSPGYDQPCVAEPAP